MGSDDKYVYTFEEGDGKNKKLLGGKGANLCEMTRIGLPVPPGFVISTEACLSYLAEKKEGLQPDLMNQVREAMAYLERKTGRGFGSGERPLLVSVRSGAAMSMPGMMDTILNLGLNGNTLPALIRMTQNERFAYDAYRRFIQLFGSVALDLADEDFDRIFNGIKENQITLKNLPESPRILMSSWSLPSKRSSDPGWENGPLTTARSSTSPRTWRTEQR